MDSIKAFSPPAPEFVPWPEGGESGSISVEGGEVSYHLYGKGKPGTPMVFLHGGPGGRDNCFWRQIPLAQDRPLVFYNQLGSGESPFSPEITTAEQAKAYLTIEHYVNEVQTVVDYFGFTEFFLVGSSWGTMLAVEYAAAKKPAGLKGLVLNGPFLNVDTWIGDAERLIKTLPHGDALWHEVTQCEAAGDYGKRYAEINRIYSRAFNNRHPESLIGTPSCADPKNPEGISPYNYMWGPSEFSCTGTLKGHDSTCLLKEIPVPILYVSGQYDSGSPLAAFHYQSMTPHGEVCVLPGCAHNSSREQYEAFNSILTEFAERNSRKKAQRRTFTPACFEDCCDFLKALQEQDNTHVNWNWGRWEWNFYHPELDSAQLDKMALWYWDGNPVAMAVYDLYPGEGFFAALPGHEGLEQEVLDFAVESLRDDSGFSLAVNDKDTKAHAFLTANGFYPINEGETVLELDLESADLIVSQIPGITLKPLDTKDTLRHHKLLWQGFDHEGEVPTDETTMSRQERLLKASHLNPQLHITAVDENGDYAGYCGLWYAPGTDYVYVEPVCTVPAWRGRGVAKAVIHQALSNARALGAKKAYVISDMDFYKNLGFCQTAHYTFWHHD